MEEGLYAGQGENSSQRSPDLVVDSSEAHTTVGQEEERGAAEEWPPTRSKKGRRTAAQSMHQGESGGSEMRRWPGTLAAPPLQPTVGRESNEDLDAALSGQKKWGPLGPTVLALAVNPSP